MVHHCERLFHGEVRDEVEEPIVVEDDERVGATLKSLDPGAGVVHAAPFRPEWRRGQGDHDTPGRLGELREKRGNPGARAAVEATSARAPQGSRVPGHLASGRPLPWPCGAAGGRTPGPRCGPRPPRTRSRPT